MEIIAKTNKGCLISATKDEANEILRSVNGKAPDKLEIGQKIPAIDYAATITKVTTLGESYTYTQLCLKVNELVKTLKTLDIAISNASLLDLS